MKTKLFALAAIAGILFSSCTKNNEDEEILPVKGSITGTITESKTFAYGNYTLSGIVKVNPGVTVTFEAGSTITCDKATGDNAFVVLNGGKVYIFR